MNIKYILLGFAVLLTACSSDNDEFNITNANRTQLAISTEIVTTRAEFYTGLKNDVEFRNGNQIGFTLVDVNYKKPIYEQDCNIKAVYNNGQWEQERTTTLSNKEGKVIAYYPYGTGYKFSVSGGASGSTIGQHFIPVDISSFFHGDGQQEYLCGESNNVSSVSPNARIKFRHVLPRITFVIEKGSANANDEIYLRSAVLKNANDADNTICTKGTMNIESGYLSKNDDGGSSITNSYLGAVPLDPTDEQLTFDFLVFPTEVVQGSVILRIEVRKGTAGNFQYYDIPIPATKWESGKQYTYPVTLSVNDAEAETPVKNQTFTVNGVSFTMVGIEAGTFQMGASADGDNYTPVHAVTLTKNFYMGETEVTQALWYAVMGQKPTSNGSAWSSTFGLGDNYPAYWISYEDCEKFLAKLNQMTGKNFRFPTEAEWEFAAKGGNKSKGYTYAGSNTIDDVAWYYENSGDKTHVVKGKTANELGLYDMSGNLSEWCYDWYGSYSSTAQTDPTGPTSGSGRVYRGGSWLNYAGICRVSGRLYHAPGTRGHNLGLRLAL